MAKNLGERKVKVSADTKSVRKGTKDVKALGKATSVTGKEANIAKRKQESLHKSTINTSKAFSKQQQGLGGLVRAYATIAANVFALTAAFGILRAAADYQSMIISAENLESRMGTSVQNIAKDMQKASGNALDLRQSLEATNRALAAGFNQSQIKDLTDVVSRASQTFGGSVQANMNKAIQAVLRGRTETLATMGIVIDINKAYLEYGATIGKTVNSLSKYEQQQAVINALLGDGKQKLDGIQLDPNPFQKLANTLFDTAQAVTTTIVSITQPFINLINTSKEFAGLIIGTLAAIFAANLTPDAEEYSVAASRSLKKVADNAARAKGQILRGEKDLNRRSAMMVRKTADTRRKYLIDWVQGERRKIPDVTKTNKTMQALFKEVEEKGKNAFKNISSAQRRALGTMQSNLTRYINDTSDKSVMGSVKDIGSTGLAKDLRRAIDTTAGENRKNTNREIEKTTYNVGRMEKAWNNTARQVKLTTSSISRSVAVQRNFTNQQINQYGLVTGSLRAYRFAMLTAERETRTYAAANGILGRSFKIVAVSAKLATTTISLFARGLNALPWLIGIITTAMFVWKIIAEKLGIGKVSKQVEEFAEASKELDEVLAKNTRRLADYNKLAERLANTGLTGLAQKAGFLQNAINEILTPLDEMGKKFNEMVVGEDGKPIADSIDDITNAMRNLGSVTIVLPDISEYARNAVRILAMNAIQLRDSLRNVYGKEEQIAALDKTIAALANQMGLSGGLEDVISMVRSMTSVANMNIEDITATIPKLLGSTFEANEKLKHTLENARAGAGNELLDAQLERVGEVSLRLGRNTSDGIIAGMAGEFQRAINSGDPTGLLAFVQAQVERASTDLEKARIISAFQQMIEAMKEAPTAAAVDAGALKSASEQVNTLMTDILKLRETKGDTFLNKAGVGEEVKILRGLSTAFKDVSENNRVQFIADLKVNKELMAFLGLKGSEDFGQVASIVEAKTEVFRRFAENLVFAPMDEEIRKSQSTILEVELKRTTVLDEIAEKTQKISELNRASLAANIETNKAEMRKLAQQILMNGATTEQGRLDSKRIDVLAEQNRALKVQLDLINPILDGQLAANEALQARQSSGLAAMNSQIGAMQQIKGLLLDTTSIYEQQNQIFKARTAALKQQESIIETQIKALELKKGGNQFSEEDFRELIQLEGQLATLMAQQISLSREQYIETIRAAANAGDFGSKEQSFLLEFVLEGQKLAQNMVDSGARVAQHISGVIKDGFGMVVDKLLDGSKDFLDAFKDILRSSLGDFLKQNINEAMVLLGAHLAKSVLKTPIPGTEGSPEVANAKLLIERLASMKPGSEEQKKALEDIAAVTSESTAAAIASAEQLASVVGTTMKQGESASVTAVNTSSIVTSLERIIGILNRMEGSIAQKVACPPITVTNNVDTPAPTILDQRVYEQLDVPQQPTAPSVDNSALIAAIQASTSMLNALNASVQALPAQIQSSISTLVSSLNALNASVQSLTTQLQTLKLNNAPINVAVDTPDTRKELLQIAESNKVVNTVEESSAVIANTASLDVLNNTVQSLISQIQSNASTSTTALNALNTSVQSLTTQLQTLSLNAAPINLTTSVNVPDNSEQLSGIAEKINPVGPADEPTAVIANTTALNTLTASIQDLIIQVRDSVRNLITAVNNLDASIESLNTRIQSGVSSLTAVLNNLDMSIQTLTIQIRSAITPLITSIESLNTSIQLLAFEVQKNTAGLANIQYASAPVAVAAAPTEDPTYSIENTMALEKLTAAVRNLTTKMEECCAKISSSLDSLSNNIEALTIQMSRGTPTATSVDITESIIIPSYAKELKGIEKNTATLEVADDSRSTTENTQAVKTLSSVIGYLPVQDENVMTGLTVALQALTISMEKEAAKKAAVEAVEITNTLPAIPDNSSAISELAASTTGLSADSTGLLANTTALNALNVTNQALNLQIQTSSLSLTTSMTTLTTSIQALTLKMGAENAMKSAAGPLDLTKGLQSAGGTEELQGILNNTGQIAGLDIAGEATKALNPIHAADYALATSNSTMLGLISTQIPMITALLQTMALSSASDTGGELMGMLTTVGMGSVAAAADGAIFKGMKRYANGGIVKQPELAMIGEGKNHEAVIPMPNNKEVPVQLMGSQGSEVNVTNVYDFRNADPASETRLRAQSEKLKRDTFNSVFNEINKGGAYAKMVGRRK